MAPHTPQSLLAWMRGPVCTRSLHVPRQTTPRRGAAAPELCAGGRAPLGGREAVQVHQVHRLAGQPPRQAGQGANEQQRGQQPGILRAPEVQIGQGCHSQASAQRLAAHLYQVGGRGGDQGRHVSDPRTACDRGARGRGCRARGGRIAAGSAAQRGCCLIPRSCARAGRRQGAAQASELLRGRERGCKDGRAALRVPSQRICSPCKVLWRRR